MGLRRRLASLAPSLPAGVTGAVLWCWAIAGGFGLVLKAQRIAMHPQPLSTAQQLLLAVPELAFTLGMASLSLLLGLAAVRLRRPWAAIGLAQLLAAGSAILHSLSHGYYVASGQPLDYAMFAFSLARAGERVGVVASEADWELAIVLAGVLLVVIFVPIWHFNQARPRRSQAADRPPGLRETAPRIVWLAATCSASLALTGYPPARNVEKAFARDPVSMLGLGFVRSLLPDRTYRRAPSRLRKTGPANLQPRPGAPRRNVVVIMLESTRADATTPYAPKLKTTPFLERFARESVLVERAYAVVPHTTKAIVAILCGFEPEVTLSTIESQPGGLPGRCLPSLLADQGYETAYFQAPTGRFEDRRRLAENLGFATFVSGDEAPKLGFERINYFGYEDAIMLEPSARWLAARAGRPFMVAYLSNAAHHPYGVPKDHPEQRFTKHRTKNKYLNAIHYTDGVVERIVEQYRRLGLLDSTIFVVVGDHGEAFGEHGLHFHDDVMFEETLRVPLLLRLPGAEQAGRRIRGPISELAIVPTLLGLSGFEPRDADYEHPNFLERPAPPVLYAHCYRSDRCAAVLRHPLKLISHFDERPAELYDLSHDPGETRDLAEQHPELVDRWSRELADVRHAIHSTYAKASARALRRFIAKVEPNIPTRLEADFGGYLSLRGVRMPSPHSLRDLGKPGYHRFFMRYYFYVHRQIPHGFSLRLTMRGDGETVSREHKPLRGLLRVEDFPVDRYVEDAHRFSLPEGWKSPTLAMCLSLIDARGGYVPVTQPGKPATSCLPIATLRLHESVAGKQ